MKRLPKYLKWIGYSYLFGVVFSITVCLVLMICNHEMFNYIEGGDRWKAFIHFVLPASFSTAFMGLFPAGFLILVDLSETVYRSYQAKKAVVK
jgi:hypothetical protein